MAAAGQMPVFVTGNHRKYRAALKKEKRKKRRQELARLRDSGLSREEEDDADDAALEERRLTEEKLLETEREKSHVAWLLREQKAQEEFRLKKEKEEAAKRRQEELERKLKEDWEEEQKKEKEEKERKRQEREEALQRLDRAESELENGVTWQNPEPPLGVRITEKDPVYCPFYSKTGVCRFGERCSRLRNIPTSSPTLLIKGMFTTFGMEQCRMEAYDPDASLEYSEEETYQQFLEFYEDVLPEFRNVGKVVQFKVSCNFEPHLRGNVYIQYQSKEDCQTALSLFNGRWYAGRQLQCEFCPVTSWQMAICGLFESRKCPRGKYCNFLHVFRNPNNEFWEADLDMHLSPDRPEKSDPEQEQETEVFQAQEPWPEGPVSLGSLQGKVLLIENIAHGFITWSLLCYNIAWNFKKFLMGHDGVAVGRYSGSFLTIAIQTDIEAHLSQGPSCA
ncbi:U2 small nuclear ribonucleoprotein auxiliary factor 35 kDa subunit-related protein 2-like [Rhynchocyon petersi]